MPDGISECISLNESGERRCGPTRRMPATHDHARHDETSDRTHREMCIGSSQPMPPEAVRMEELVLVLRAECLARMSND